jgi:hypothetical protein
VQAEGEGKRTSRENHRREERRGKERGTGPQAIPYQDSIYLNDHVHDALNWEELLQAIFKKGVRMSRSMLQVPVYPLVSATLLNTQDLCVFLSSPSLWYSSCLFVLSRLTAHLGALAL